MISYQYKRKPTRATATIIDDIVTNVLVKNRYRDIEG